ncbi:DUF4202 family protein [Thermogemmatispora carboxidivorans]|uniref:DUF4202 family protein n=1 Tax=Thermogemmatispora carboxidivorans TaxID=1382306 RepID=UPI000699E223|nr:DUF4202 family protein [Thermogemmatispora carboxidivorans]
MENLLAGARSWVKEHAGGQALHLLKAEEWLRRINPEASEAMLLAALTHDMERAFPGPDSPKQDLSRGADDPLYLQAHSERSARIVGDFLREQQAPADLIEEVMALIRVHELGGWPEADWVQAADSLSFLEVNVQPFLHMMSNTQTGWTPEAVRAKFSWMYSRIRLPEARHWATPLYQQALERLQQQEDLLRHKGKAGIEASGEI